MWQRFTERARRVILVAQEEAAALESGNVTSEHLLLAFFQEGESPAARFLHNSGLDAEAVRAAIARSQTTEPAPNGIALSQEAKNVLTDAAELARELFHGDIDSHHLLLALLGAPRGNAARLLKALQHNPQQLRAQLEEQLKQNVLPIASHPDAVTAKGNTGASWTRFTERSRHVILLAQEEVDRMQHSEVGTHHLFLALLREGEGTASQVLTRMGLELAAARQAVQALQAPEPTLGPPPKLSSQAKRALELSAEEAHELRHNYIGTEHLLLALLHPDCGLSPLLKQLGKNSEEVRARVMECLGLSPVDTTPVAPFAEKFETSAWERFDVHTQRVLNASPDEALRLKSDFVSPQHLLLALAAETTGVIGLLWQEYGVTPEMMRQAVEMQDWPAETVVQPDHAKVLSLKSLRVLELAADEARRMRSRQIGREHLLLALLRSKNNPAASVLEQWGMKLEDVRTLALHWRE